MAAPQSYNYLESRILEEIDLQNGYRRTFLKMESSKLNTKFLITTPRKLTKDFSNCCLYIEKIDVEGGPRQPKKANISTLAEN